MKSIANIGPMIRIAYIIIGVVLLVAPLVVAMEGWVRIALPILGVVSLATGAVGW